MDYAAKLKDHTEILDRRLTIPFSPFASFKWTEPIRTKKVVLVPTIYADQQYFQTIDKEYATESSVILPDCKAADDARQFVGWTSVFCSDIHTSDPVIPPGVPFEPSCAYTELKPCFTEKSSLFGSHTRYVFIQAEQQAGPHASAESDSSIELDFTQALVDVGYDPNDYSRIAVCVGPVAVRVRSLIPPKIVYNGGTPNAPYTPSNMRFPNYVKEDVSIYGKTAADALSLGRCTAAGDMTDSGIESRDPADRTGLLVANDVTFDLDLEGDKATATVVCHPAEGGRYVTGISVSVYCTVIGVYP